MNVIRPIKRVVMHPPKDPLIAVVGATGTGKSKLAIDLALRFNGEIINGDAMQMYKGLPVITNKVTPAETQGVPHHLFDFINPIERPWNVGTFTHECLKVLGEIRGRGKVPILVGGTHYYTQSLLFRDSLVKGSDVHEAKVGNGTAVEAGAGDGADQQMSKEEKEEKWPILKASGDEIYVKLKEVDPIMARRWHPNDTRKVRRSLEIWLETGRPASEIYEEQKTARTAETEQTSSRLRFPTLVFWIQSHKDVLRDRLDKRVDQMVATGLMNEVEEMMDLATEAETNGTTIDTTSGIWASIGYKEVRPYVLARRSLGPVLDEKQERKLKDTAIELTKIATRQYVTRQERWIKYKFMDAMEEAGEASRIFPVDSTYVEAWDRDVGNPSGTVAAAFLEGRSLPDPRSTSAMAKELLDMLDEERRTSAMKRAPEMHECAICDKILTTRGQWEEHLRSTRHKKALRSLAKANPPS